MSYFLDFEKQVASLEGKIAELKRISETGELNIVDEVAKLEKKIEKILKDLYKGLSPWQKVQVARHPERPHFKDCVSHIFEEFVPLAGDRYFGEDLALMGGLAKLGDFSVVLLGHEKGWDTESRVRHNFGMPRPEGYRKAIRLMKLANRLGLPVISIVDTAGAHPGADAEARGQSDAIARCIEEATQLEVPSISVILGEGGSGGAIALATTNRVWMLEHAIYSVISPEGCASILWRDPDKKPDAAEAQKLTAQHLAELGVIDGIIEEPLGGAHRNPRLALASVKQALLRSLQELSGLSGPALLQQRADRFLQIGRHPV